MEVTKRKPTLLTPREAAKRLKLHPETVRSFLRSGELAGFKIGSQWRVPESRLYEAGKDVLQESA